MSLYRSRTRYEKLTVPASAMFDYDTDQQAIPEVAMETHRCNNRSVISKVYMTVRNWTLLCIAFGVKHSKTGSSKGADLGKCVHHLLRDLLRLPHQCIMLLSRKFIGTQEPPDMTDRCFKHAGMDVKTTVHWTYTRLHLTVSSVCERLKSTFATWWTAFSNQASNPMSRCRTHTHESPRTPHGDGTQTMVPKASEMDAPHPFRSS